MNAKDVVTSALDTINVMTAGALQEKGRRDDHVRAAARIERRRRAAAGRCASRSCPTAQSLLDGFKPSGERYPVAARITASSSPRIPNGAPRRRAPTRPAAAEARRRALKETAGDANVIMVADTDMLADMLWVRSQNVFGQRVAMAWANNGDFLANAVDNLAGSSDLISIRGRQSFFRPFTKVDELRRHADERLRAKEKELDNELKDTEQQAHRAAKPAAADQDSLMLSPEQEAELTRFQQERVRIRKELREVRRSLDVEIERLGTKLKVLNIALVPALLAIGAIVLAVTRRRRLRAGRAAAHTG